MRQELAGARWLFLTEKVRGQSAEWQALYDQLEPRGRLVVPVGRRRVQRLEVVVRSPEGPAVVRSVPCRFVPLVGEQGFNGS